MIEWINTFIGKGFWNSIGFLFLCFVVGIILLGIFRLVGVKNPGSNRFTATLIALPTLAAWFIIWHIRGGVGWLIFGILGALGVLSNFITLSKRKSFNEITKHWNS